MTQQGKLLWFNELKDCGAIRTADGERLEFTGEAFAPGARPQGRCAGTEVEFRVVYRRNGPTAAEISVVPYVEPRRARSRARGAH